jgi:hypothetical protein
VWGFLVVFGIITVALTYLFGMESLRTHRLIVGALAATICSALILIRETQTAVSWRPHARPAALRGAAPSKRCRRRPDHATTGLQPLVLLAIAACRCVHEVDRDRVLVILQLPREGVG